MTNVQVGRLRQVGIGKEGTKGTGVVPAYWLPVDSFDANPIVATKQKAGAVGRIEDSIDSDIVSKHNEPSLAGYVTDKSIGLLLLAALGTDTPAPVGGQAGCYDHAITVKNDTDHPALTISFKDANIQRKIQYSMLNELSLDCALEDHVRFSAGFTSRFEASTTGLNANFYSTDNVFIARHVSVKLADTVAGLGAAQAISLNGCSLKIKKNVLSAFGLGSNEPLAIYNRELTVEGEIEAIQADTTWRDLFTANTTKVMQITITNTDVTIGSSTNPAITIVLAKVKFNPYKEDGKLGDLIKEKISFKSQYSLGDSSSISITVRNTVATY